MTAPSIASRIALAAGLLVAAAATAQAQTGPCPSSTALVVGPRGDVCVTPAPDYNATALGSDGVTQVPIVVRLDLLLFGPTKTNTATDAPDQTISLGKPSRDAVNNSVWANVPALTTLPLGQTYKARVVAVGQPATAGGPAQVSGRSPESNPFLRPVPSVPAPTAPVSVRVPE